MITRLTLRNFKSVGKQEYDFTQFDLMIGRNNSGKSTVLQALAIWQFCVDEFHRSKRTGSKGIQVVLPNFTAVPVPEFNLLWKDKTDRQWPSINGKKKQEYILIGIDLEWIKNTGEKAGFGVELRYHSPQTIYAIPGGGWTKFREHEKSSDLPRIAYVPPFSGLEPTEKWLDVSPIRQQVGKGQPGSVLRNLLLWVYRGKGGPAATENEPNRRWKELADAVRNWFSVEIQEPQYESGKDVYITVDYAQGAKDYDIIAGGSGFHQVLTLLAFLYGYEPTTILLDEPDAHLHVNLQREILDYFRLKSSERGTQCIIATHAEEFIRGVDVSQIVSLLCQAPRRINSTPDVIRAMADVSNREVSRVMTSPHIVYVEGESDERILRAWAMKCGAQEAIGKILFKPMGGGAKKTMKQSAEAHFLALRQIVPEVKRLMLFDYDTDENAFHPDSATVPLVEWQRKNIENYLLVPDAWHSAVRRQLRRDEYDLLTLPLRKIVDEFFASQNLTLPPGKTWRNVSANVFSVVDGKRILFEDDSSLYHQLEKATPSVKLPREQVAMSMEVDEIHEDVHELMRRLVDLGQLSV